MRIINKNNRIIYKYARHIISDGVKDSIVLFLISIIILLFSIVISILFSGQAPSFIAGFGISSMLFNFASMTLIILEIYLYDNYNKEIRYMLMLQIALFTIWMIII